MKMTSFAMQRTHSFSFDNFAKESKENSAKNFSCYCKKTNRTDFFMSALL